MLHFLYLDAKDVYAGTVVECGGVEVVVVKLSHIAVAANLVVWVVPRRTVGCNGDHLVLLPLGMDYKRTACEIRVF